MRVTFEEATASRPSGTMFRPKLSLFWHSDRQAELDQPPPPQPHGLPAGPHGAPVVVSGNWPRPAGTADAVTSALQAQRFDQTHLPMKW